MKKSRQEIQCSLVFCSFFVLFRQFYLAWHQLSFFCCRLRVQKSCVACGSTPTRNAFVVCVQRVGFCARYKSEGSTFHDENCTSIGNRTWFGLEYDHSEVVCIPEDWKTYMCCTDVTGSSSRWRCRTFLLLVRFPILARSDASLEYCIRHVHVCSTAINKCVSIKTCVVPRGIFYLRRDNEYTCVALSSINVCREERAFPRCKTMT